MPIREGNRVFFERNSGLQPQAVLYVVDLPRFEPRVLLDPNALSKDGTVALTGTVPSRDGALLAYGIAEAGSDWQEWRVKNVGSGEDLPDRIQWVKFSSVSWTPDGRGFYYSRYDAPGPNQLRDTNYFQKLYYHRLGTAQSADTLVYERKDQKEWGFGATVSDDGRWLVVSVWQGSDRRNRVYIQDLAKKGSKVRPLIDVLEARYGFIGSQGSVLWFLTTLDAPRGRIIAIDMRAPDRARWKTVVPETDARLEDASAVGRRLVLNYLRDAHSVVRDPRARRQAPADAQASRPRHGQRLLRPPRPERDLLLVRDVPLAQGDPPSRASHRRPPCLPRAGAQVRARRVREPAGLLSEQGRHPGADDAHLPEGHHPGRQPAGAALRLRRLRHLR